MKSFLKWAGDSFMLVNRIKSTLSKCGGLKRAICWFRWAIAQYEYPEYLLFDTHPDLIHFSIFTYRKRPLHGNQ